MARTYPIYQAKAKLSGILRQVKHGRSVTILERGADIARVVALEPARDLRSRREVLERSGLVAPAHGAIDAIR